MVASSHVRKTDNWVKPDAIMPHPHDDLSLNRLLSAAENETWHVGHLVAAQSRKNLYGRVDIIAARFKSNGLRVDPDPVEIAGFKNTNHAIAIQWPAEKSAQKLVALEIIAGHFLKPTP